MDTPLPPTLRQEELDEFLRACAMVTAPTRDISRALVQQLCQLLQKAPQFLKRYFTPPIKSVADPLFDADALEQILLLTTQQAGILTSRSQSGNSIATVALRRNASKAESLIFFSSKLMKAPSRRIGSSA